MRVNGFAVPVVGLYAAFAISGRHVLNALGIAVAVAVRENRHDEDDDI